MEWTTMDLTAPKPPRHYPTPAAKCADLVAKCADLVVHVVGLTLALVGGAVLLALASRAGSISQLVGVSIYAAGVVAMLAFSTAYNSRTTTTARRCGGWTMRASS
jgi:hemolysin III